MTIFRNERQASQAIMKVDTKTGDVLVKEVCLQFAMFIMFTMIAILFWSKRLVYNIHNVCNKFGFPT